MFHRSPITSRALAIGQYCFQFFKGYSPLSTGVRLLPVAFAVGIMSVLGTQLAVRFGTKQVVTTGLLENRTMTITEPRP